MSEKLFVYGSLRKGLWGYEKYLTDYESIGNVRLNGYALYTIRGLGYPFIVPGDGEVVGELFLIDLAKVSELDSFEDIPIMYTRNEEVINGERVWVYVYTQRSLDLIPDLVRVPSGDWLDYTNPH